MGLNESIWGQIVSGAQNMVGTRWNKVGTGYGVLVLTTLTILEIHKFPNLEPRDPKMVTSDR